MQSDRARELLGVGDKFTARELKAAFRRSSFLCHPDTGGSEEQFHKLQMAYEALQVSCVLDSTVPAPSDTLVDGTPLSELGGGFPLTESACQCEKCEGLGYKRYEDHKDMVEEDCPECGGTGSRRYPCKRCGGDGKYKHPKTGKAIGECRGCNSTGWFYPWNKDQSPPRGVTFAEMFFNSFTGFGRDWKQYIPGTDKFGIPCKKCKGHKKVEVPRKSNHIFVRCTTCDGIGEVKMWNPVLPRGYLASGG